MSILIKGMKMPEKCGSCDLFHVESPMHCTVVKGHKTVGAPYGMTRPDWCPLIEISEPHGDLIDRDVLLDMVRDVNTDYFCEVLGVTVEDIDSAHTVIEAEGSEDE